MRGGNEGTKGKQATRSHSWQEWDTNKKADVRIQNLPCNALPLLYEEVLLMIIMPRQISINKICMMDSQNVITY